MVRDGSRFASGRPSWSVLALPLGAWAGMVACKMIEVRLERLLAPSIGRWGAWGVTTAIGSAIGAAVGLAIALLVARLKSRQTNRT
jgi:hypothetical protein